MEKICRKCGEKLPIDSEFCQYCGAKVEIEEIKPKDNNIIIDGNVKEQNSKMYKILIVILVLALGITSFLAINFYTESQNYQTKLVKVTEEKDKAVKTNNKTQEELSRLKTKTNLYDDIIRYAKKSNSYSDAYVKETVLYQPMSENIPVYWARNEEVWLEYIGCTASWSKTWNGSWTSFNVTCLSGTIGYVRIYNKSNTRSITITIIGSN